MDHKNENYDVVCNDNTDSNTDSRFIYIGYSVRVIYTYLVHGNEYIAQTIDIILIRIVCQ